MKKQYVQPELNILVFDVEDIITLSFATGGGDGNGYFDGSNWVSGGDEGGRGDGRGDGRTQNLFW